MSSRCHLGGAVEVCAMVYAALLAVNLDRSVSVGLLLGSANGRYKAA